MTTDVTEFMMFDCLECGSQFSCHHELWLADSVACPICGNTKSRGPNRIDLNVDETVEQWFS